MRMVKVIWNADERELPGIGVARKGGKLTLPHDLAKSYLDQKLAVADKSKSATKEKEA